MNSAVARLYALLPLVAISLIAGSLHAQAPGTGAIVGTVHDPAGLVVASAQISAVSDSTGATRSAVTNSSGVFTITLLQPGTYTVSVSVPNFEVSTLHGVDLLSGETSTLDFHLAIKSVGAELKVTADVEIAQTESATLGRAVEEEAIRALPLENRNYTQILSLSPGVIVALPNASALGHGSQDVASNGAKTTGNNIQFNGVDANNLAQNSVENETEEVGVAIPAPDTIQEFKVQTANYDAGYGRGNGANVDVVSKSGTNHFHGDAWEFLRNNVLNANDFFLKLGKQPQPDLKQNQFGGAIGGPILRNKAFFFGAYQGLRSVNGFGAKVSAILPQLTSDRSAATLGAQFCPASPGRVSTPYLTHAGGTQVACDGSNINPVALALLNFKFANGQYAVPSPQVSLPSTPAQLPIGLSTFALPAHYSEDQFTANLDDSLTSDNQMSARFFYSHAPTVSPFATSAATVPGWGSNEVDQNAMLVLSDTQVMSSNLVNVFRFGYMRFDGIASVAQPISVTDLGTERPTGASQGNMPDIILAGLFSIGDASTPSQFQETNSFIWQDTIAWARGRHNLRFGAEAKRHQVEVNAPFSQDGVIQIQTFDDLLLGESAAQNKSPQGLSNIGTSRGGSGFFRRDERYTDFATFAQDDIRLSSRLVFNAGVRYEIFGTPSEIHGELLTFDPTIASASAPAGGTLSGFIVPANFSGSLPVGVVRSPHNGLWNTNFGDVSPRLGFALRLTNDPVVVLRGGYGIYFDRLPAGMIEGTLAQQPFSVRQIISGAQNGPATLQLPYSPLLPANSSYPLFQQRLPGGSLLANAVSPRATDPYMEEYNLNFQYSPQRDFLFEVGYVGTRRLHVAGTTEFNQAQLASPSQPINGVTTNTVANVAQRVPFAGLSPQSLFNATRYVANFNSLQASATKRMSHGLQFLGSYTWSKALDQTSGSNGSEAIELWLSTNDQNNPRQAYGLTDFDRTHRGVLSLIYDAPNLRQGPWLARKTLDDWQLSGILVAQSGTPETIIDNNAGAVYGTLPQEHRAQVSGSPVYTSGSLFSRVINGYLNANAFTSAPEAPFGSSAADTGFGNSSVGMVRGPGQRNIDMAVERQFALEGRNSVHVRAEFFNLTNTPNFSNPNRTASTGSTFGTITSMSNNPRIIQFALKYAF